MRFARFCWQLFPVRIGYIKNIPIIFETLCIAVRLHKFPDGHKLLVCKPICLGQMLRSGTSKDDNRKRFLPVRSPILPCQAVKLLLEHIHPIRIQICPCRGDCRLHVKQICQRRDVSI